MMRKKFPLPHIEGPSSAASSDWSPPPAPYQFQNAVDNHDQHSNQEEASESHKSEDPPSSYAFDDLNNNINNLPKPDKEFEREATAKMQNEEDDYIQHQHRNVRGSDLTRLSFGSMFTQLRRLPRRNDSRSSIIRSPSASGGGNDEEERHSLKNIPIPPSTLTSHQRNKNLHLLRSWTDEGHYSRVQAMTIASILYNIKVTEGDIRAELTPQEKFAYKKFCLEIEDKLEMITSREPARRREPFTERTLRKIWHLYALYTKALSDEIWDENCAKSDITSRAIAHLVKRALAGGPAESPCTAPTTRSSMSSQALKPVDPLESVNPVLASTLKDPIQAFLIVYGRYVSTGKVNQIERLRKLNNFNDIAEEFFQKLVEPPENVDIDTYLLLLRQQQQQFQQKWSSVGFTGYGGRSNISMPFSPSHSPHHRRSSTHRHRKRNRKHKRVGSSLAIPNNKGVVEPVGNCDEKLGRNRNCSNDASGRDGGSCPPPAYVCSFPIEIPPPPDNDNDVKSLQRKIQMLDGKKRVCLAGCRYEVLSMVAISIGFEIVGENDLWNINWSDSPLAQEKIMQMRRVQDMYSVFWGLNAPLQKCNHFPGMYEICRKDRLGRNLNRLKRMFPTEYNFFPETFDLPTEQTDLIAYARRRKKNNLTFIIKPESGCQGKGIFLLRNLKKLSPFAKCVCQLYIPHPFLIDGYKFDQRIYVLITCVDPLRLYIYDEGIARFATVKYEVPTEDNLEVVYMHLTNYSLNKFSESYVREGDGSKRPLSSIYHWMAENGYDVTKLIRAIDDIVVKTLLCAAPTLKHNYKTSFPKKDRGCSCFELLGFDILIDRHLNPFLLEVNHSPSFHLDLPVDHSVKMSLLKDLLNMVYLGEELNAANLTPNPQHKVASKKRKSSTKRKQKGNKKGTSGSRSKAGGNPSENFEVISEALQRQFQHEMKNRGQFRLIFSSEKPGRFQKFSSEDTYCGYNVMTTVNPPERQLVVFDRDPDDYDEHQQHWRPTTTSSTVKITKQGHKYVETKVVHPEYSSSSRHVQKFREIPGKCSEQSYHHGERQHQKLAQRKTKSEIKNSTSGNNNTKMYQLTNEESRENDRHQERPRPKRKGSKPSAARVVMCSETNCSSNNNYPFEPVKQNKNGYQK